MTDLNRCIPAPLLEQFKRTGRVQDEQAYTVVNGSIYVTSSEDVAIAIIDSTLNDVMVIVDRGYELIVYTNCYGLAISQQPDEVKLLVEDWCETTDDQ